MIEYDEIDISEVIDVNKKNHQKTWYLSLLVFLDKPYLCSYCHDLMQKDMNFNDVTIVSVKESDYKIQF